MIKKLTLLLVAFFTSVNLFAHNDLTQKQINDFDTLASQYSPMKLLMLANKMKMQENPYFPFQEADAIPQKKIECVRYEFSEKAYRKWFHDRVSLYLSTYPNRYDHDIALLKSKGLKLYFKLFEEGFFEGFVANNPTSNTTSESTGLIYGTQMLPVFNEQTYDLFSFYYDPLNEPLRELLAFSHSSAISNAETYFLTLRAAKKCDIDFEKF